MSVIDIILPAMGEGVIEATITQILVQVGSQVNEDDSLFEIATDKVDSEIPSPEDGVVTEILVAEGDVAKVGQLIARIETNGEEDTNVERESIQIEKVTIEEPILENVKAELVIEDVAIEKSLKSKSDSSKFLSPLVRSIMSKENISFEEVSSIQGTGALGRVTKDDLLLFIKQKGTSEKPIILKQEQSKQEHIKKQEEAPKVYSGQDELIEMDRMRKLIAEHMVHSVHTAPHVTSFVEADLTKVVNWRNANKVRFEKNEGEKLTFMPIFIEAMTKAIKDFPMINVSVDGNYITKKKAINVGMAAALPSGNLIVPVIKNADEMNLVGLAKRINDLANRSRKNKLQPDEIQGSTITITNMGTFGNITGTPIINQPNVAILAVGAIQKKPAVIETPDGDFIGIRHKMILSLAYDHRVVDGALGGMFLKRVSDYIENFDVSRTI
ncbi:MAG: 2-oxo acid dehydrogenase subunit E2 [Bacteroidales bacterium]|nr:2-oxo acid dehydrogenase subunit E2 [Bacteroidales bacterium]